MKQAISIFLLFLLAVAFNSCESNRWKRDVTSISYDSKIQRFEVDLFKLNESGINETTLKQLYNKYPQLFELYTQAILKLPQVNSPTATFEFDQFVNNKDILDLFHEVEKAYPLGSLTSEELEIKEALKLYKSYFPESKLPALYTIISLFGYNIVVDDSLLAISLEMYLGGDFKYYPSTNIPKYKFKNFDRKFMVSDAVKAYLISEFDEGGGKNLLEQMIFYGKIAYLQKAFLPKTEEHVLFNYNIEELAWCEDFESEVWFHLVDMDLLYTGESEKIRKYLDDAPFIPGFPEGSSARVGKWIGYRIVSSYMNSNSSVSLAELMNEKDANQILLKSKYKPSR
ncbi:MAG: hypothetical protein KDB74_00130 [Flavobacteriales bacterium]|nr:hypothetical protein [Flavobacteriales bacterium]